MHNPAYYTPTRDELEAARHAFEQNEPRDLFYRAATELLALARQRKTSLTVAEAIAVLLQTWNHRYYVSQGRFDNQHFRDIEGLLTRYGEVLATFASQSIEESGSAQVKATVYQVFESFETILGPVGASKCLHLLAPRFFPLWDNKIAEKGYHIYFRRQGENADNYIRFMECVRDQCAGLGGEQAVGPDILKRLDEYNYARFTGAWI